MCRAAHQRGVVARDRSARNPFALPQVHVALQDTLAATGGVEWELGPTRHRPLLRDEGIAFNGQKAHRGLANESETRARRMLVLVWCHASVLRRAGTRRLMQHYYPGSLVGPQQIKTSTP